MPEDIPPSKELPQDATRVLQKHLCGSFKMYPGSVFDRPIYAMTLYWACCHIKPKYGIFVCCAFESIIYKGYIIRYINPPQCTGKDLGRALYQLVYLPNNNFNN